MPRTTQSQQLGNSIRERRQTREPSLAQLANALNERITDGSTVEKGYLHRLENGSFRQPRAEVLETLSKVLGGRLADLYSLAQIPLPKGAPRSRCTCALPLTYPRRR